ncbi:MAG: histidinol phosphate aminotransferase [Marinibacterium sp.]|nr:histidinol phosphate aminotransferase [Marinibacterium sp.]
MPDPHRQSAPDFTTAALTMLGVNLIWIFVTLWVIWGFLPVLLLALCLNHAITRLKARRAP